MKTVTLDGWLIVLLAIMPALTGFICGDEAAHYITPFWLWIMKGLFATTGVGLGSLKAYRSMQYAQYKLNGGADPSTTEVKVQHEKTTDTTLIGK